MLKFDAETLKLINVSYLGADVSRRRMENVAALNPQQGERILDLGCGQGMMTEELARAVGPDGEVVGIDPSPDMREDAKERCANIQNVRILDGAGGSIPVKDGSLDAAISLQVFEYLPDIPGTLKDLATKLRPRARVVIGDMQWGTLSWASDDPDRMHRMCRAWEAHVVEPDVPALLPSTLQECGFDLIEMRALPFSAITLRPDGLPFMVMHLMRGYAIQNELLPSVEAEAWFEEQETRASQGRFFFSLTHFIAIALRH